MRKSLSVKIIGTLFFLSFILFSGLSYFIISGQRKDLTDSFIERAKATAYSLEAGISSDEDIKNRDRLLLNIQKNIWLDAEIKDVNFNLPEGNDMVVYVSSNQSRVGQKSDVENINSFNGNVLISKIVKSDDVDILRIIAPIQVSGQQMGTIQVDFTLENVNRTIRSATLNLLFLCMLLVLLFFLFIYLFLRFTVIRPLLKISRGLGAVAENNFDYDVRVNSKDEIGSLASAFNMMVGVVKKSREEIETKVREQTKEIKEKAEELEKQKNSILNILQDVEKEKNKMSAILYSIGDGVFVVDENSKVILVNKVAAAMSGYEMREILNTKYSEKIKFISEETGEADDEFIRKAMETKVIQEMSNHTVLVNRSGKRVQVSHSAAPLLDSLDRTVGCVVVFRDVTKEREIDKAKTEFVSLASHQLRTPLSSINWYTEMLLGGDAGKLNKKQKNYLGEVANGSKRMVDMVSSLLNVSRLDLGTFVIEPELVNVTEMAKNVVKELKPQTTEKKIKIKGVYDKNIPKFLADKKLLRIVFQNLLSNAIKYTHNKGTVTVEILPVPGGQILDGKNINEESFVIKVSDTGMGIPNGQQDKVFSKMFRADNAREAETEGTGLGLYIVKSIVDHSNGLIWFKSEEGVGTTFYIVFPLSGMKKKEGVKNLD